MSWPRSSLQEPELTKKQTEKRNEKRVRRLELFVMVRMANIRLEMANIRLEMEGYDTLTGLRKGVTQAEFDKANEDYRKKKSKTACSEVECQPVNPQGGDT